MRYSNLLIAPFIVVIATSLQATNFASRSPAVHFNYNIPKGMAVVWAYAEARAEPGPAKTYNCALGFSGGYFGFQRNDAGPGDKDRRFIFSLWDKGFINKGDKATASSANTNLATQLVAKGDGVDTHDFDHEGSGGHSHWQHAWKDKETYSFLLGVKPDKDAAVFTAYVFLPEMRNWKLIASFRRPNTEARLKGLYSFVEDFGGKQPMEKRVCHFSNIWVKTQDGPWLPVTEARSSVSAKPGRGDFDHRVEANQFVLSTGGGAPPTHSDGKRFSVAATTTPPKIQFDKLPNK